MKNNEIKKEKKSSRTLILLIITALILLSLGIYVNYISSSKRVIGTAIEKISTNIKGIININQNNKVGDNYTLKSNVKMNIESNYLNTISETFPEYKPYINILNNLSKTNNDIMLIQNKDDKKLFVEFNSTLSNQKLINAKYLIQDNTEYYFINGFLSTYINNGNNNYFESLNNSNTSNENIEYIYDFCIKSLKNNLKDAYFKKEQVTEIINGNDKKVTKISIEINNDIAKEIARNILNDLKNDKKATTILTGIDKNFKKSKINDNVDFFDSNEIITISVYTNNITYKALKYEVMIKYNGSNIKVNYENNIIKIQQNEKLLYKLEIIKNNNGKTLNLKDRNNNLLANISITKNNDNIKIVASANISDYEIDMVIDSKTEELKKNKEYKSTTTTAFKIATQDTTLLSFSIHLSSVISDAKKIDEDVSTSVISGSLSEQEKEKMQTIITSTLMELIK